MSRTRVVHVVLIASVLGLLQGCVQFRPIPTYARSGDTIVLGLGGIQRNSAGAQVLKTSDLAITLTDANGVPHSLQPRHIFKSYTDYASTMNGQTLDGTMVGVGVTGMVPYDGGWFVVTQLTTPSPANAPLPVAVGPATVAITSPKLLNTANALEGNLSALPITIIAGTSAAVGAASAQFIPYLPNPKSFAIAPGDLTGVDAVGGAHLVINYSDDAFFKDGREPVVVPSNHNPYVQLNYHVSSNGDGTGAIHVTLLNPAGFTTSATAGPNSSLFSDLSLKLVYFSDGTPTEAKSNFSVDTVNSYYVDVDGAVLSGITPALTHVADL